MNDANPPTIPLEEWMAAVGRRLPDTTDVLTPGEISALLELAREAAHRSERKVAPLTTFLAGVAFGSIHAPEREARIRQLTEALVTDSHQYNS
jgi:hypothetical protein